MDFARRTPRHSRIIYDCREYFFSSYTPPPPPPLSLSLSTVDLFATLTFFREPNQQPAIFIFLDLLDPRAPVSSQILLYRAFQNK